MITTKTLHRSCTRGAHLRKISIIPILILMMSFLYFIDLSLGQNLKYEGNTLENWDILDWRGDARIYPTTDLSCPPGYGPEVLHIKGTLVLGMIKDQKMSTGTFVALYRENAPRDYDADGIIMVKSDYDLDISRAHNIKEERMHLWLEQDNDCGIQLRIFGADGKEVNIVERCGEGVVTDPWNRTNWIWQKINIQGDIVRAKTWPAHESEPEKWHLVAEYKSDGERFGFRINSGNINLAYFAADEKDIPILPSPYYLHAPLSSITKTDKIDFILFTNRTQGKEESLRIAVSNNGKLIGDSSLKLNIPSGNKEFNLSLFKDRNERDKSDIDIHLLEEPAEGTLKLLISDQDGMIITERSVMVLPVRQMRERFAQRERTLDILNNSLIGIGIGIGKNSKTYKTIKVIYDAATAHLDRAKTLFENGNIEGSDLAFRFVDEALAELAGYKKAFLSDLDAPHDISIKPWDNSDRRGIDATPQHGISDAYSMNYLISFGEPEISSQSLVMGKTYDLKIPWHVEGEIPDKDFNFLVRLVSPLGHRVVAKSSSGPVTPTSKWESGKTYVQQIKLTISPEDPERGKKPPAQPAVLDEYHHLLISVIDPDTGGRLILGNAPGPQPERVGQSFFAGEFYVSSSPLEIKELSTDDGIIGDLRHESISIVNLDSLNQNLDILFRVKSSSKNIIYQDIKSLSLKPGELSSVNFNWESKWAGEIDIEVGLIKNNTIVTEAIRKINIDLPDGENITLSKANTVVKQEGKFYTPIHIAGLFDEAEISVYAGNRLVGKASGSNSLTVNAEPWFGYYDMFVKMDKYTYSERLIATVVEVDGMDILVNGEPFLIKGVNVHGLDGRSPERTASMMRIMRELGFNAWRGDYPPLWQMDLAYELNSFYTVLGPFSCTPTEEIFARQAGPPMTTARELSRLIVERYKNTAGVLLWNSCNEIGGEKEDFILSLQPVFKAYDPYQRPVHYSNLFGQDLAIGQDIMGINYYFGAGQTAADKQPIIQRSIEIARKNNIPVMYNEFNSFAGAIHSTGVEAMYDMYDWGLTKGMCGGFQYMKGNSTSHPGIFDDGFNTHKIYDEAIIDVLADAEVSIRKEEREKRREKREERRVILQVRNKRRFALRQIRLEMSASGMSLPPIELSDLAAKAIQEVEIALPQGVGGPAVTMEGTIEFVTHHGFKNKIAFWLVKNL